VELLDSVWEGSAEGIVRLCERSAEVNYLAVCGNGVLRGIVGQFVGTEC
jgi:hypothetical protein